MLPAGKELTNKQFPLTNSSTVVLCFAARLSNVSPWFTVICSQFEGCGQVVGSGVSGVGVGISEVGVGVSVGKGVTDGVKVGSPGNCVGKGVGESVGDGDMVAVLVFVVNWAREALFSAIASVMLPARIAVEISEVTNPKMSSRRLNIKTALPRFEALLVHREAVVTG